jgi:hypothetical protein
MISFERKLVKIKKVTGVEEFKGDKRDYGCSVRIQWVAANTVLDEFDKHVRTAYYERDTGKPAANPAGQEEMSLPRQDVELTKRKCINVVTPLHFVKEYDGYEIIFHRGATDKSEIKLTEVKLDDFMADPQEGGSVLMECNAYMKPAAEVRGFIDHMSKTEIEITLTPPVAKQAEIKLPKESKKKAAADKIGTDADPFANSDLAQDASRIDA